MERSIGSTDLRRRLTDVLQAIQQHGETYVIETFGRPQAALVNLAEYRQLERFRREREAFFEWLQDAAVQNAARNARLSDDEVGAIIKMARRDVAAEAD